MSCINWWWKSVKGYGSWEILIRWTGICIWSWTRWRVNCYFVCHTSRFAYITSAFINCIEIIWTTISWYCSPSSWKLTITISYNTTNNGINSKIYIVFDVNCSVWYNILSVRRDELTWKNYSRPRTYLRLYWF